MSIEFDCSEITDNIRALLTVFDNEMDRWAKSQSNYLQSQMQRNRPWHDRSHEARRRLHVGYKTVNGVTELVLSHGVEYGVYLELAHKEQGEEFAPYAIIGPVVRKEAPKVMASYNARVQKIMRTLL